MLALSQEKNKNMKNLILAIAMLLTTQVISEAKTPVSLAVTAKSASSYEIAYTTHERSTVKITVTDESGKALSSRVVRNIGNFKMPVQLQDLKYGKYYVTVDNGSEVLKKELNYQQAAPIYTHVSKLTESKYLLSISNTGVSQPVKISVYDASSNLLHSSKEIIDGQKAVVVRMQNVKGDPTFEVSDPSGQFEVIQK